MSKLFAGCLFASDIDGTLVHGEFLHPDNVKMINKFKEDGGMFVFASGRSAEALRVLEDELGELPVSIVCNGAVIYDFKNNKTIYEKPIPNNDKFFIKKIMEKLPDLGIQVHSENIVYVLKESKELWEHIVYEKLTNVPCSFETAFKKPWYKVVLVLTRPEHIEVINEIKNEFKFENSFVEPSQCFMNGHVQPFIELHPSGTSKSEALKYFIQYNNLQEGKVFAIGDHLNDISLLQLADVSAAVKEALDEVKAKADYQAVSCKDGAVADFIGYLYNLKKKGCI